MGTTMGDLFPEVIFPSMLDSLASAWSEWMLAMSWQASVVVLVIAGIAALGRSWPARFRYSLWLIVLVKLAIPPSFAAPTGFGWWLREGVESSGMESSVASSAQMSQQQRPGEQSQAIEPSQAIEQLSTLPQPRPDASTTRFAMSENSRTTGWTTALFIAWSALVAARFALLVHASIQVRSWVRRAMQIKSPRVLALLASARAKVGWRGSVELRNSESCVTPLVVGYWRPTILLPNAVLERLDDAELESVLAHELVHLRRRDSWVRLATAVARSFYFFHPAVWWLGRELDRLREDACDESTVAALRGRRHAYGSALVKTAELLGYEAPHLALTALDRRFPVKRRLLRVLDPNLPWLPSGRLARITRWCAFGLITLVLLPAGAPRSARLASADAGVTRDAPVENRPEFASQEPAKPQSEPPITDAKQASSESRGDGRDDDADMAARDTAVRDTVNTDSQDLVPLLRDPATRHALMERLLRDGATAERKLRPATMAVEPSVRRAAYEVLESVATVESLDLLEQRYLAESGAEQAAAKRALDAVWRRIREAVPRENGRREPARFFESQPVDQDEF